MSHSYLETNKGAPATTAHPARVVIAVLILFVSLCIPIFGAGKAYAVILDRKGLQPSKTEIKILGTHLSRSNISRTIRTYDLNLDFRLDSLHLVAKGSATWSVIGHKLTVIFPDYGQGEYSCGSADPFLNPELGKQCSLSSFQLYPNSTKISKQDFAKIQQKLKEYFDKKWPQELPDVMSPGRRLALQWLALVKTMTLCVHRPGQSCRFTPALPFPGSQQGPIFTSDAEIALQVASDPTVKLTTAQSIQLFLESKQGKTVKDVNGKIIPMPLKTKYTANSHNTASRTVRNLMPGEYVFRASALTSLTSWRESEYKVTFKVINPLTPHHGTSTTIPPHGSGTINIPHMHRKLDIHLPKEGQIYTGTIPVKISLPESMKTPKRLTLTWSQVAGSASRMLMRKSVIVKPTVFFETKQNVAALVAKAGGEAGKLQLRVSLQGYPKTLSKTFNVGVLGNPVQNSSQKMSGSIGWGNKVTPSQVKPSGSQSQKPSLGLHPNLHSIQ
jgi:hypothetical protein